MKNSLFVEAANRTESTTFAVDHPSSCEWSVKLAHFGAARRWRPRVLSIEKNTVTRFGKIRKRELAMALQEVQDFTRGMYARVTSLWTKHRHDLSTGECGYALISGPPQYQPKLIIIGENPGFGVEDVGLAAHEEATWPDTSYLPTANWKLANKLRAMFADAGLLRLHNEAIMTNFHFFKSGSVAKDEPRAWADNDPKLRQTLEQACVTELREFIRLSEPEAILVLGIGAFERFADNRCVTTEEKDVKGGRRLIVSGRLFGVPAVGIMHPTGSQIANSDIAKLSRWLGTHFTAHTAA